MHENKHEGMIRGFYHLSEAWYGEVNLSNRRDGLIDDVMIGFYGPDGNQGTSGEFSVEWKKLGDDVIPRLCVFEGSWEALSHFSDLLAEMAILDGWHPTPKEFCKHLIRLGIKDLTPREGRKTARNKEPRGDRRAL